MLRCLLCPKLEHGKERQQCEVAHGKWSDLFVPWPRAFLSSRSSWRRRSVPSPSQNASTAGSTSGGNGRKPCKCAPHGSRPLCARTRGIGAANGLSAEGMCHWAVANCMHVMN